MYNKIYKLIKKYENIVIARHIGVDPDAYGSQIALKDIILNKFPSKKVYTVGSGSYKLKFIGDLDKVEDIDYSNTLLIVLDTPIRSRIDVESFDSFDYVIKIDHHPLDEVFGHLEWIEDGVSSTCQMVYDLSKNTKLKLTKYAAERLFYGIISDTNRFLYDKNLSYTLKLVSEMINEHKIDTLKLYENLYIRKINELRLQGFISENMTIKDSGLGYIVITNDIINEYGVDAASAGNMVNNFSYIEELLVWMTVTEDTRQNLIRISIRSRGPIINEVASEFGGGGHNFASGVKLPNFDKLEEIINKLEEKCLEYKENK